MSQRPYRLYRKQFSLHTGKARAYRSYKGIAYHELLATIRRYQRVIAPTAAVDAWARSPEMSTWLSAASIRWLAPSNRSDMIGQAVSAA